MKMNKKKKYKGRAFKTVINVGWTIKMANMLKSKNNILVLDGGMSKPSSNDRNITLTLKSFEVNLLTRNMGKILSTNNEP